jgi:hypothetical protein
VGAHHALATATGRTYRHFSAGRLSLGTRFSPTKLKVHIQLVARNGRVVLERAVEEDGRFISDNLGLLTKWQTIQQES